jgi:ABC-type spermidine/putrescine transport system permease subunit II
VNIYTSEAVDFFALVLTSGLIAVTALAVACLIGFTVAFVLFRERASVAVPAGARAAAPAIDIRPQPADRDAPAYTVRTPAAVAG